MDRSVLLMLISNLLIFCLAFCLALLLFNTNQNSLVKANENINVPINEEDEQNHINLNEDISLNDIGTDEAKVTTYTADILNTQFNNNVLEVHNTNYSLSNDLSNQIWQVINSYGYGSSFMLIDLSTGMMAGYNVDSAYETASSIKVIYAYYICTEISKGNIDPNQEIEYLSKYYNKGTGLIKNSEYGTKYTVKELIRLSLHESDNIAHIMLHATFGVDGFNQMLSDLGCSKLYLTKTNPWGFTSPRSAALVWQEIYHFAYNDETGLQLFNILLNNKYNYYKEVLGEDTISVSKTGWANSSVIQSGIIFRNGTPYIAMAMARKVDGSNAYGQVLKLIRVMGAIIDEYEQTK